MEQVTKTTDIALPYGKEARFEEFEYENGFKMLRIRLKEGKRFTTLELDLQTGKQWLEVMQAWCDQGESAS